MTFIDREKVYGLVTREGIKRCAMLKNVTGNQAIILIYEPILQDENLCVVGESNNYEVMVGLHQGSTPSLLIFRMAIIYNNIL